MGEGREGGARGGEGGKHSPPPRSCGGDGFWGYD